MCLLDLFQRDGGRLGGSNAEKWGGHQKKFFINNSVEVLIPFKEELPVPLEGGRVLVWRKRDSKKSPKEGIFFEGKNNV